MFLCLLFTRSVEVPQETTQGESSERTLFMAAVSTIDRDAWMSALRCSIMIANYISDCYSFKCEPILSVGRALADEAARQMCVSDTTLRWDACLAMSLAVTSARHLTELRLERCHLTDSFMDMIGEAVTQNRS